MASDTERDSDAAHGPDDASGTPFELERVTPRGVAWSTEQWDETTERPILDDSALTVTVWRESRQWDYEVRVRKGSNDMDPFDRWSPDLEEGPGGRTAWADREEAIGVAEAVMNQLTVE